jgi:hypothetical protein
VNHGDTESTEKNEKLYRTAHGPSMPSEYDKTDCSYFAALIDILSFGFVFLRALRVSVVDPV